jgi:RNA polymerase sigma factor (sigma-70 family)
MAQRTIRVPPVGEARWAGLMAQHERLVHWVVHRQGWDGLTYTEAVQAGRIGLWHALQGYDPRRGTRFSTYAVPVIRHAVWRAVAQQRRATRGAGAGRDAAPVGPVEPDTALAQAEAAAALREAVEQLPARLQQVVVGHWGLGATPPESLAAIGRRWGVSRQRVHQLHVQALVQLAHPACSGPLRRVVERAGRADYQQALAQRRAWARAQRRRRGPR